ncbi:MAG: HD domain-containing protein [Oscillochloris sp.]|nr:HD domain-containing protein [Oscillochloris sp.]
MRGATISEDLHLRDFTVNALAMPLDQTYLSGGFPVTEFLDPCGGLADLHNRVLRPCGPTSLPDDPLRTLRAARVAATLGLKPAPGLDAAIRAAAPGLDRVAGERIRDELLKLLSGPTAAPWLYTLDDWGILTRLFPELEPGRTCDQPNVHFLPVLEHSLETVTALEWLIDGATWGTAASPPRLPTALHLIPNLSPELPFAAQYTTLMAERRAGGHRRAALLKLAALLHDNAKPQTKQVHPDGKVSFYGHQDLGAEAAAVSCRRLRFSRNDSAYVAGIIREHMRPGQLRAADVLTARAQARFFRDLGDQGPDVLLHELADHMATRGPQIRREHWQAHLEWIALMLQSYWGAPPERRQPLVRGNELMDALGLPPGRQIGEFLREIAEAQAAGEISTHEEAISLARQLHTAAVEEATKRNAESKPLS